MTEMTPDQRRVIQQAAEDAAEVRMAHDRTGGRRCPDCELMLDYRTPRQVRLGLPADPHECVAGLADAHGNDGNHTIGNSGR